jgi:hypothetical protein
MTERMTKILLVVGALLLVVNLASMSHRSAEAQSIGTVAKLPTHGACIGIIAERGILFRAFADGTVEGYRIGSGQSEWWPVQKVSVPPEKR